MKYRTRISTTVSLPTRTEDYLERPRNGSFSCLSCLLLATSLTLTVLTLSIPQFIPYSGVLSISSVFQLCQVFCHLWSYTKNVFLVCFAPEAVCCCPCYPKCPSVFLPITAQAGAKEDGEPLGFPWPATPPCPEQPLQSAGPQKLHQPWSTAGFSYGVLGHAQHLACTASLLVERNPNHSFLKVVMRQWFKVLLSSSKVLKFITVWVFTVFLYLKSASDLYLQFEAYSLSERCSCFYLGKKKILKNCVRCQNLTHIKIHNKFI